MEPGELRDAVTDWHQPLSLRDYIGIVWRSRWPVASTAIVAAASVFCATLLLPSRYRATAVIRPSPRASATPSMASQAVAMLGALSDFGFNVGARSDLQDLEVIFRSHDLAFAVVEKHGLWAAIYPKRYDPKTGKMRPSLVERVLGDANKDKRPAHWTAVNAIDKLLSIIPDRKSQTIRISFEAYTAEDASRIVTFFLEAAKDRMQAEAIQSIRSNKAFILAQAQEATDPILKSSLYLLYAQEVQNEVMAHNRDLFGFVVVDRPEAPNRRHYPRRTLAALLGGLMAGGIACLWALLRQPAGRPPDPAIEEGSP